MIHTYAQCPTCGWHVEDPSDAEQERHRKQPGHVVVSRFHDRNLCTQECAQQPRRTA